MAFLKYSLRMNYCGTAQRPFPTSDEIMRSLLLILVLASPLSAAEPARLEPHNTPVPFCFQAEGKRSWRILTGPLAEGQRVELELLRGEERLAIGSNIEAGGLSLAVSPEGRLQVTANAEGTPERFRLRVTLINPDETKSEQTLSLRAAPPPRPIGYLADLVDDLIHTYYDANQRAFRPISRGAFDQYFRRLQAHGTPRLIVWHSPFPYFTRPEDHDPEHWRRYAAQSKAILESQELRDELAKHSGLSSWQWLNFLMELRLNPESGPMFAQSAAEHGIALTASFEPFEAALTKYYDVPAFDAEGNFLWGFLPLATPAVNYTPENICFAHYREILSRMGHADKGRVGSIDLPELENVPDLLDRYGPTGGFEVYASPFPPIASDSFVLSRTADGDFELVRYEKIREQVDRQRTKIKSFRLERGGRPEDRPAMLTGLTIPAETRFLLVTHPHAEQHQLTLDREFPVALRSKAGNRLQRETIWWVFDEAAPGGKDCRIAGIAPTGEYRAVFQANQSSISQLLKHEGRVPLAGNTVVIDLGPLWSVEMMDFQQAATRELAVKQLKTLLGLQAAGDPFADETKPRGVYDEIFINTRSHVDLATSFADGVDGQKPIAHYYRTGRRYLHHLGLDKAYAPRAAADNARLKAAADSKAGVEVERITTWQDAEWREPCQEPDSPFLWRLARNEAVADGVTQLLRDLEREFPATRIRAVIPPREASVKRIQAALEQLPVPAGGFYGRDYYQQLWCSNNHIPTIGEGMAMVDLAGTRIEPVFLGSGGYQPDDAPFRMFIDDQIRDLAENRGSNYRGPRSYFLEAQFTLRAANLDEARRNRERMICELLSRKDDIREVLLYEATDWLHTLPLDEPDYCSHRFTERCK